MSDLVRDHVQRLAFVLASLRQRVRMAVASEVSRAVADSVAELLAGALSGRFARKDLPGPRRTTYPGDPNHDDWDDPGEWDGGYAPRPRGWVDATNQRSRGERNATAFALAAALAGGRLWLARKGSPMGAVGLGLGLAIVAIGAGPLTRVAIELVCAAERLLSATNALGDGSETLDRV